MPIEDLTQPAFERTFEHEDWIDGVSVVQAEATNNEPGFNTRFNAVATDLGAVQSDHEGLYDNDKLLLQKLEALQQRVERLEDEALVVAHDVSETYTNIHELNGVDLVVTPLEPVLVQVTWQPEGGQGELFSWTQLPKAPIGQGQTSAGPFHGGWSTPSNLGGQHVVWVTAEPELQQELPVTITAKVFVRAKDYFAAKDAGLVP